jgi:hypothetical protein
MSKEQAKCCGTCKWWFNYWLCEGGCCCRDYAHRLASEVCPQWEIGKGTDKPDEPEEVTHDA